jgi:signal transduction histidine kinase/ActR/RegA family two-component response regulator
MTRGLSASEFARLHYRSQLLDRVMEGLTEGLIVRDASGRITLSNSVARDLMACREAPEGWLPSDFFSLEDPSTGEALDPADYPSSLALRGIKTVDREVRMRPSADKAPVIISTSAQPIYGTDGRIEGSLVWFRDVTLRRDTEMRLQQAQKMEAMGQLAGGIAHDFNNLLTVIVGSCEVLFEEVEEGQTELLSVARQIESAATRGAQLTHRLLAMSRRQPLKPVVLDLNELVSGMMPLLRRAIGEDIQVDERLCGDLGTVLADGSNFENALLNLAVNARDAMPEGGTLTIETGNTVIPRDRSDVEPGEYVLLRVSDTGSGMSADVKARVFEPFFTTKESGKGSGLGLATIFGFVTQSGGFIQIDSAPGEGTTVTLGMPRIYVSGVTDKAVADGPPVRGRNQLVLVVEDDADVRVTLSKILQEIGYRAVDAPDAAAGLDILRSRRDVDLLLTDVVMPGMNGWDLAKAATALRPDLPVLFATGYTDNVLLHRTGLDARIHVLTKPFRADDLARALHALLSEALVADNK